MFISLRGFQTFLSFTLLRGNLKTQQITQVKYENAPEPFRLSSPHQTCNTKDQFVIYGMVPLIDVGYLHLVMDLTGGMSCMLISIAQGSAKGMIGQSILSGTEKNVVTVFSAPNYCYRSSTSRDTADPKTYTTATDQHGKENLAGLLNTTESFPLSPSDVGNSLLRLILWQNIRSIRQSCVMCSCLKN
ncbi:hypothetical protein IGI04_018065 [Brassica rapa subsp. trilocularis]|uniref:Xylanase inhibitor N-terminal domain-containing protein n=1 Tax=Brassica rapa subsp. trilocularis TaxID=1813537 RepID=A0ABQ7ME83_BRACM|nr:hypothetical protein IGI04_018065 [Brassica rapa subsp. trilocularis]